MKKLLLITFFFITFLNVSKAQEIEDTLGIVEIRNTYLRSDDTLVFDLYLLRFSDIWRYYANGTYQFEFLGLGDEYDYDKVDIKAVEGTSELQPEYLSGKPPYDIWSGILQNRISIFVLGPDRIEQESKYVYLDSVVRISTFKLFTKDGTSIPEYINWKQPTGKWQSNAFKIDDISLMPPNIRYFTLEEDDNIEMDDGLETMVIYSSSDAGRPQFVFDFFEAEYAGVKNIRLNWRTLSEVNNYGFKLYKAPRYNSAVPVDELDYELVATYENGMNYFPQMEGEFYSENPKDYSFEYDTVRYRGGDYCYKLSYEDANEGEKTLAYSCVNVPNAVIVEAKPSQNPFDVATEIQYKLEDDVYLTVEVYDAIGRYVKTLPDDETGRLLKNFYKKKGVHTATFHAKELSSQGLYNVIITAIPVNDNNVEISRAVVKTQYMRD